MITCSTCKHCDLTRALCRRNPPQSFTTQHQTPDSNPLAMPSGTKMKMRHEIKIHTYWPPVNPNIDWCGDWALKEEVKQ